MAVDVVYQEKNLAEDLGIHEKDKEKPCIIELSTLEELFRGSKRSLSIQLGANELMNLDRDFHMAISELVGNSQLVSIMNNVRNKAHLMWVRALSIEGRMEEVTEKHEKIVETVENGREEEALMEYHLHRSKRL